MVTRRDQPPPLSPEVATELGYVAAYWAMIDSIVSHIIAEALGSSYAVGDAVTAEMSALQKLNLLSVLINLRGNDQWMAAWEGLEKRIEQARIQRNELLHSLWISMGPKDSILRVTAKRKLKRIRKYIGFKEIEHFKFSLKSISSDLSEFAKWVGLGFSSDLAKVFASDPVQNPTPNDQNPSQRPSTSLASRAMEAAREAKRAKRKAHHEINAKKTPDA